MKPLIISFATDPPDSSFYRKAAVNLKAQCDAHGMECVIETMRGDSWLANTRRKPAFILEHLLDLKGPVLWVDVDSRLCRPIDLDPPALCDIGVCKFNDAREKFLIYGVGTLLFRYTALSIELLEEWAMCCSWPTAHPDHHWFEVARRTTERRYPELSVWTMPRTYSWHKDWTPDAREDDEPIISVRVSQVKSKRHYIQQMKGLRDEHAYRELLFRSAGGAELLYPPCREAEGAVCRFRDTLSDSPA